MKQVSSSTDLLWFSNEYRKQIIDSENLFQNNLSMR